MSNVLQKLKNHPIIFQIHEWMSKGERSHNLGLLVVVAVFLGFGLNHLGQFVTVDEEKWLYVRVRQLWIALENMDWQSTFINDKPGVFPSILAGIADNFTHVNRFEPEEVEDYLFFWRLPLILFSAGMLVVIYKLLKKLTNANYALVIIATIGTNPLLIGLSQIVNPDTTLWSTCTPSALLFLVFIKNGKMKYALWGGFMLSLGLLSKFSATYFFLAFYGITYLAYLIGLLDSRTFLHRCVGWCVVVGIASLGYFLLFPVTWINPEIGWRGTFGCPLIAGVLKPFAVFVVVTSMEASLFRGVFVTRLRERINIEKLLYVLIALLFLLLSSYLLFRNTADISFWGSMTRSRGHSTFWDALNSNFLTWLFTENSVTLVGMMVFTYVGISSFFRQRQKNNEYRSLFILSAILAVGFIIGSGVAGQYAHPKYQAVVYPLYGIVAGGALLTIFNRPMIVYLIVVGLSVFELFVVSPFYYCYSNRLNVHNHIVSDAWGLGGYEIAQWLNKQPDAHTLKVWYDREGFRQFFIGDSYRWTNRPWQIKDLDFLVLTKRGQIAARSARSGAESSRYIYGPLLEYYDAKGVVEIPMGGNPLNITKLVRYEHTEMEHVWAMQEKLEDAVGHFDMTQPQALSFWIRFDQPAPGKPFRISGPVSKTFRIDAAKLLRKGKLIIRYDAPKKEFKAFVRTRKINDGKWHHIYFYQTGGTTDDTFAVYTDGILTDSGIVPKMKTERALLRLNADFNGDVINAKVHTRLFTKEELIALHAAGPNLEELAAKETDSDVH